MAKQEIFDAINATIAPNNIKGITADSLRNVLTLMAENAGSGSGEGALRVMLPMDMFGDVEATEMDFTPEYWETVKVEFDSILPGLSAALDPIVEEIFRHNAEVYSMLMEKAAKNEGVMCLLDMSAFVKEMMGVFAMAEGITISFNAFSMSIPSTAMMVEAEPAEIAAEMGMPTGLNITPLLQNNMIGIQPFNAVELRADGSVRMYIDAANIKTLYVPLDNTITLHEGYMASNASIYAYSYSFNQIEEIAIVTESNSRTTISSIKPLFTNGNNIDYFFYNNNLCRMYRATVADDGSVTVTTIGVINPPTA